MKTATLVEPATLAELRAAARERDVLQARVDAAIRYLSTDLRRTEPATRALAVLQGAG